MKKTLKLFFASVVMLAAVVGLSSSALAADSKEQLSEFKTGSNYETRIRLPRTRAAGIPEMKLGGKRAVSFSSTKQIDVASFKTSGNAGSHYKVWIKNNTKVSMNVVILDRYLNTVGYVTARSGQQSYAHVTLYSNTEYYIGVEKENIYSSDIVTGSCEYGVSEVKKDAGAGMGSAYTVKVGSTYNKAVAAPGEQDWLKFTTNNTTAYYHLYIANTSAPYKLKYTLMDASGKKICGDNLYVSRKALKLAKNKTYYIKVEGADAVRAYGYYTLSVKRSADGAGNSKGKAKTVKVNKAYNANIDYGNDVDWYKFKTGSYTSFKLDIAHNTYNKSGYRTGATYTLYKSNGKKISSLYVPGNYKGGSITLKNVPKKTTLYLKVQASAGTEYGNYKITLRNPKSVSVKKPTLFKAKKASKTSAKISWTKKSGVSGYQIYYSYKKSSGYSKMKTVSYKKGSYTKKNLKKGKTYYFKMRSYKKVGSLYYYSKYTTPKKVKL